ncbi:hypothetical protein BKA56DRAFT_181374 [Ilyonectria sp. MPI-CAGE-AT-0026]|nr:hypothetical protein BKA56DRAFT_181374 [Ilyonectria sp. MPI-CAGE-AT-0026]
MPEKYCEPLHDSEQNNHELERRNSVSVKVELEYVHVSASKKNSNVKRYETHPAASSDRSHHIGSDLVGLYQAGPISGSGLIACPGCGLSHRGDGSDGSNGGGGHASQVDDLRGNLAPGVRVGDGVLLSAVPRDVASLATLVAGLSSSIERTAVGGGAVARDVAQLAAGVALHGLSLAVAGKVVRTTALVASTAAAGPGAAQAEGRAVSLDVAQSLAVIALLGFGGTGERAAVRLVACSWNRQHWWW